MKITAHFEDHAREIDLLDLEEIITLREQWRGSHLMRYPVWQQPTVVANTTTDCYRKMDRNHEDDGGNRTQSRQ